MNVGARRSNRAFKRSEPSLIYRASWVSLRHRLREAMSNSPHSRKFLRRHEGQVGWIIGNGPSVRIEDLEALPGFPTFAANRIYLAFEDMSFRPNYLFSADALMIQDFGAEMVQKFSGDVFFARKTSPEIDASFHWLPTRQEYPLVVPRDPFRGLTVAGGSLVAAIQMAIYMGINHLFLYGVDHHFVSENGGEVLSGGDIVRGGSNHFIAGYRSGREWRAPVPAKTESAFLALDNFLRVRGGWLVNSTRGGHLEILERRSFDDAVALGNELSQKQSILKSRLNSGMSDGIGAVIHQGSRGLVFFRLLNGGGVACLRQRGPLASRRAFEIGELCSLRLKATWDGLEVIEVT